MNRLKTLIFSALFLALISQAQESNPSQFSFKKGEVMDLLLISFNPDITELYNEYRQKALPIAAEMSITIEGIKGITETTQGNLQPQSMLIGKWDNITLRERFLDEIDERLPDFHERRRAIWSYFGLTYFEMPQDLSFAIDNTKYTVVTAYWKEDEGNFNKFVKSFKKKVAKHNGNTLMFASNGKSPLAYAYQPDYLEITEWDSKEQFEKFYNENLKMDVEGLSRVHQFVLK